MSGNLKTFKPGDESARQLSEAGLEYYTWLTSSASRDGEPDKDKTKVSDWMDLAGSAGMVMGAIKKRDGDQRKFVITMENSSPHVVIPYKVELPADKFYAKSSLCLMTPGDSSEAEFDVNHDFLYKSVNPCKFNVYFTVVASNGKYVDCCIDFDAVNGEYFLPQTFSAYGGYVAFLESDTEYDKQTPDINVAAVEGTDDSPSFAFCQAKVVCDPEDGTSKVFMVIAPWKVGTVVPNPGFFEFPSGDSGTVRYERGHEGAVDLGRMAWNYLKRSSNDDVSTATRGAVGGLASLVSMGVNLLMGARNLNRKDNGCHNLVLTIKNMTTHCVTISRVVRAEGCYFDNCFIPPHGEGTVHLGTKNFAGGSADNDKGPCIVMSVSGVGSVSTLKVKFLDSTHSGFSGQIRVREVGVNDDFASDFGGYSLDCKDMSSSFYRSNGSVPEFVLMTGPVSKGEADLSLVLIN